MTNEIGGCQGRTGMRGTTSAERTANEQNSVLIHRKLPWWQLRVPTIAVWLLPQQQNVAITAQSASCASRSLDTSPGGEQPHESRNGVLCFTLRPVTDRHSDAVHCGARRLLLLPRI